MTPLLQTISAVIALQHFAFLILEMFLWKKPLGLKIFRMSPEVANASATLAANQGLYNGFLSAGLVWALVRNDSQGAVFFLSCVSLAGIFGGITVNRRIFFVQGIPAILGLTIELFK